MPKVLVIDDEAALTKILSRFLGDAGFEIETATSGREGLQKAVSTQPDAIVLDIMMPDMDGYEVCRRLRRDPRTARMGIMVLSARGQSVDRQMALRVGADTHAAKPIKSEVLVEDIQHLLADKLPLGAPLGFQILVLRLKGGAGATTLANNLALCLKDEQDHLTVIADMALQVGHVDKRLGLPQTRSWLEAPTLGPDDVAAHLVRHESGLFALPAPALEEVSRPDPEIVRHLLQMLREWYDYVIVDTPRDLGNLASALVRSSWLILLLLTPDPASLKTAKASLAAIRKWGTPSLQIWPVLNKMNVHQRSFEQQVEKTLGLSVAATLPWSPKECIEAEALCKPVVLSYPDSTLTEAIQALSRRVVEAGRTLSQGGTAR